MCRSKVGNFANRERLSSTFMVLRDRNNVMLILLSTRFEQLNKFKLYNILRYVCNMIILYNISFNIW